VDERWWAPQRATTTPDTVVTLMLDQDDLATTLLAMHRAGAAACESVAKSVLPSSAKLLQALAEARGRFAPPAVSAVSKNLEERYAGLLVRDVLADAESATLALYGAAVSKGVSPPVAASRAGAVYGVPARELGRYAALATDPKSGPAALTDAADRALLGFVAKLSAAESDDPGEQVTFSKAPVTADDWDEASVNRDEQGRFATETTTAVAEPTMGSLEWIKATLGITQTAPAQVADLKTEPKYKPRPARKRARPQRRPKAATEPATATRTQTRTQTRTRVTARSRAAYREVSELRERARATAEPPVLLTDDLLKTFVDPNARVSYDELDIPVAIAVPDNVGAALKRKLEAQQDNPLFKDTRMRVFRAGNLLRNVKFVTKADEGEATENIHQAAHETWVPLVNPVHGTREAEAPDRTTVSPNMLTGMDQHEVLDYLEGIRRKRATRTYTDAEGIQRSALDKDELPFVRVLPEYQPWSRAERDVHGDIVDPPHWHIVHYKETDPGNPDDRVMPTVHEFVIQRGARAIADDIGQDIILDPNAAYELVLDTPEQTFDPVQQVIVETWLIRPVHEDQIENELFGKALVGTRERSLFETMHPRDETGRWTTTETAVQPQAEQETAQETVQAAAAPAPRYQTRPKRPQRRRARPTRKTAEAAIPTRTRAQTRTQTLERTRELARAMDAAHERRVEAQPWLKQLPALSDSSKFQVLNQEEWSDTIGWYLDKEEEVILNKGGEVELDKFLRGRLEGATSYEADDIAPIVSINAQNDLSLHDPLEHGPLTRVIAEVDVNEVLDPTALADYVDKLLEMHNDIDVLELVNFGRKLRFHANLQPAREQYIVEIDKDIDWEQPVYLSYHDTWRARDLSRVDLEGKRHSLVALEEMMETNQTSGRVPNPELQVYRITNARAKRWRVYNA
jgi:hypothetical protein